MVFYVIKCRDGDDASIARRASAAEALQVIAEASVHCWSVATITRGGLVIDEAVLRQDAERETVGA